MDKEQQIRTFNKQARAYEKRRKNNAQSAWRKRLLQKACGEILELGVGAGSNFAYYPADARVTAVDFSSEMLRMAKAAAAESGANVNWVAADVDTLELPNQSFDTVVSTLSLCGYEHPLQVLQKINRWCKPTGNVLFMEHGMSANKMVSLAQKATEPIARRMSGCHHTRNIAGLVRESGILIEKVESYWFDMVHLIWAKPQQ